MRIFKSSYNELRVMNRQLIRENDHLKADNVQLKRMLEDEREKSTTYKMFADMFADLLKADILDSIES